MHKVFVIGPPKESHATHALWKASTTDGLERHKKEGHTFADVHHRTHLYRPELVACTPSIRVRVRRDTIQGYLEMTLIVSRR